MPKLLGLACLFQDPAAYGFEFPVAANQPVITAVEMESQSDLVLLSQISDVSIDVLFSLNPGFSRWATSPKGPWRIILPVSSPIIVVSVIWQFTQIWNDFLFGVVYSSGDQQPLTVGLNNLVNTSTGVKQYNVDMAAAIIAALPTLLVYVVAGKYFVRGLTAGAVKG